MPFIAGKLGGILPPKKAGRMGGYLGPASGGKPDRPGRTGGFVGRGNSAGAGARPTDADDLQGQAWAAAGLAAVIPGAAFTPEPTYSDQLESVKAPIGGGEILFSGTDPVSPTDCALWPDSPYCGGSVVDPWSLGPYGPQPLGGNVQVQVTPTEVLVQIAPVLFGIGLPPIWIGFRAPGAQEAVEDYWGPGGPGGPGPISSTPLSFQEFGGPGCSITWVFFLDTYQLTSSYVGIATDEYMAFFSNKVFFNEPPIPVWSLDGVYAYRFYYLSRSVEGGIATFRRDKANDVLPYPPPLYGAGGPLGGYGMFTGRMQRSLSSVSQPPPPRPPELGYQLSGSVAPYGYITGTQTDTLVNGGTRTFSIGSPQSALAARFVAIPYLPPIPPPSAPGLPPNSPANPEDPMSCDCKKIEMCLKELKKLVREIHEITGFKEFPVSTPTTFYGKDGGTTKHKNIPSLITWTARQVDAIGGEYPAEISAINQDGETTKIVIQNIAEGIVELYGLSAKVAVDADFAVKAAMCAAIEAQGAKNAAIVAQDYAVANSEHLGYRGNPKKRKIGTAINVGAESPADFLQPKDVEIIGWEFEDKSTIKEDMIALRSSGGIIKAVFTKTAEQITAEAVRGFVQGKQANSDFDKFVKEIQDPAAAQNLGSYHPKIVDRSPPTPPAPAPAKP